MGLLSWVRNKTSGVSKSAPESRAHWKRRGGLCPGSHGRVVNLHGRRGTCPVCQAGNLAITSEGLSWTHKDLGARSVPTQIRGRVANDITEIGTD